MKLEKLQKPLFFVLAAACLIPGISPGMALVTGILFGLLLKNPFAETGSVWSRNLLQIAVIMLGFGLSLAEVVSQAWASLPVTVVGISLTIFLGYLFGMWLKMEPRLAKLIAFGTAICGGSAIAAMAPAIKARDEETSVSLATVFSLNALALLLFPAIGKWLNISQHDFGVWAGLAIHDTSSVVGAASHYGETALAVATTVKLARALWITPFVIVTSYFSGSKQTSVFPWFILGFIAAALTRTILPLHESLWTTLVAIGRQLLVLSMFFIGSKLSLETLKKVGLSPLLLGVLLWFSASIFSYLAIGNL